MTAARLRSALGAAAALALLAGCGVATPPQPSGEASPSPGPVASSIAPTPASPPLSATPTPTPTLSPTPTPSPTPSAVAPLGKVQVGRRATLRVDPVDYNGARVFVAGFGKAAAGRPVSLQRKTSDGWTEVASGKANGSGRVELVASFTDDDYRAVAGGPGKDAVATPTASAGDQWRADLADEFDGKSLKGTDWDRRNEANYTAGGRSCSAAYFSNVEVKGGSVRLKMSEETRAANQRKARAAGCREGEYYRNAMISTQGRYTIRSGILAARVKFPVGQGMHGSIWMQSAIQAEIDMVESYGYGKGLTSVMHVGGKQHPGSDKAWVAEKQTTDRAWWDDYHVVSAQWDEDGVVVRIDGDVVQRIDKRPANVDYFLVLSLLSSDWELERLRKPVKDAPGVKPEKLPGVMEIDWVRTWRPRS